MWRWGAVVAAGMFAAAPQMRRLAPLDARDERAETLVESVFRAQQNSAHADTTLRPLDEKAYIAMVAAHRGHVLIVDFWATWCSPCREEMPSVIALVERYAPKDVQLVTVSADLDEQMHEAVQFLDSVRAPSVRYIKHADDDDRFIQSVDPAWSGALPALLVYDRTGHKVRAFFGETSGDSLAAAVRTAAGS
jgi:thiol-disulfide isomerase/thioredoxin